MSIGFIQIQEFLLMFSEVLKKKFNLRLLTLICG